MNIIEIQNKDLYQKAIEKFGIKSQINIFCEECSELMQAIFKSKRYEKIQENFYEKIADVKIMLEQLFFIFDKKYEVTQSKINDSYWTLDIYYWLLRSCNEFVGHFLGYNEGDTIHLEYLEYKDFATYIEICIKDEDMGYKITAYYNQKIERLKKILEDK